MKRFLIFIALWMFGCLTIKAQTPTDGCDHSQPCIHPIGIFRLSPQPAVPGSGDYIRSLKGEKNPFDTAVIINLSEYRRVRFKVMNADSLIGALHVEVNKSLDLIEREQEKSALLSRIILRQDKTIARKDSTIQDLSRQFDQVREVAQERPSWFQRFIKSPWFIIPVSAFGGALISKL